MHSRDVFSAVERKDLVGVMHILVHVLSCVSEWNCHVLGIHADIFDSPVRIGGDVKMVCNLPYRHTYTMLVYWYYQQTREVKDLKKRLSKPIFISLYRGGKGYAYSRSLRERMKQGDTEDLDRENVVIIDRVTRYDEGYYYCTIYYLELSGFSQRIFSNHAWLDVTSKFTCCSFFFVVIEKNCWDIEQSFAVSVLLSLLLRSRTFTK